MGAAAAPVIGGLGIISGLIEGDKNRRAANKASDKASDAENRALDIQERNLDESYSFLDQLEELFNSRRHLMDPEAIAQRFENYHSMSADDARAANRQALLSLGYKPGDSEGSRMITDLEERLAVERANGLEDSYRQAFVDEMNLMQMLSPGQHTGAASGSASQVALGVSGNRRASAAELRGRIPNPSGLVQGIMPYLAPQQPSYRSWMHQGGSGYAFDNRGNAAHVPTVAANIAKGLSFH